MMVPADMLERKFNSNHDPKNGQFTSGVVGAGMTRPPKLAQLKPYASPVPKPTAAQIDAKKIGRVTVAQASNILTNETNGLSGGKAGDLAAAKMSIANAIYNGQTLSRPPDVAPDTLSKEAADSLGRTDDQDIMRHVYMSRSQNGVDPTKGAIYYGTSSSVLTSRSIGNGRQNVIQSFGPFDHGGGAQQYVYIYGAPYFPKKKK
jgi:hypothetical protein